MKRYVVFVFIVLTFLWGFSLRPDSDSDAQIRIAIIKDASSFILAARGAYEITDPLTNKILKSDRRLKKSRVAVHPNGITIGRALYPFKKIRLKSDKDIALYADNKYRRYRGTLDIIVEDNGKMLVVNTLDLEQYVRGVLYHEVTHRWPMETMKAQAVAVRTYALYQMQDNDKNPYDVTSTIYSQVYGGRSAERYRTNLAVERTKGEILTYENKILPAYFHAHCGGHTENVNELWKQDLKPLQGVVCPFCMKAPHSHWKKNFRSKDVQEKLNKAGYTVGLIKEIKVVSRTPSDRVKELKIIARDGRSLTISGKAFREALGPNDVKSLLFDVTMQGYYFDLTGRGWGHGVGMCQWGAYYMGQSRYTYDKILAYYYPGAKLTTVSHFFHP